MQQVEDPCAAFTRRYRDFVGRALDRFEFFGVDPRGIPRRHAFDHGYVPLTLEASSAGTPGGVGIGARSDLALADVERALVRGVAGAGKSTLLRWLAVGAALDDTPDAVRRVPFLVELGRVRDGRPPHLEDLVADSLRRGMPDGWVQRVLAEGRVLLLLDGLDEVRPRERGQVEEWVDECLDAFPATRCVVTTRPSAVAEQRWVDGGFETLDLLSMSRHSIEEYVHGWHEVARADYPDDSAASVNAREWLTQYEGDLLSTLSKRPTLSGVSSNPLLAGLLCAIHLDRGENLPDNRKQVYDAAFELLLVRWPELRRRRRRQGPLAEEPDASDPTETRLGVEEQTKILQRLAVWLVRNRAITMTWPVALAQITSTMVGLRSADAAPEGILRYLSEQSGVLRQLPDTALEFVHRTFRDHLAAKELVEEIDFTTLLDNADKPLWQDVVVLAGAHARPKERQHVLERLLTRAKDEPEHRTTLTLLAAAVLEQSPVLGESDFPEAVRSALTRLIPPRTAEEADELGLVGPIVLDLLPGPDDIDRDDRFTQDDAERVVRSLAALAARWNPPGAMDKLLAFAERPTRGMLGELLTAWGRSGDYETFARTVLSAIDFSGITVTLQNQRRVDHVAHLDTITDLRIEGNVGDLGPLAGLPALRRLTVRNNDRTSLAALRGTAIRYLHLDGCRAFTRLVDLRPLAGLPLHCLAVTGLRSQVDLDGLAGLRVRRLELNGALIDAAAPFPAVSATHLVVHGRERPLPGLGPVDGLRTVTLGWAPRPDLVADLERAGVRDLLLRTDPAEVPPTSLRVRFVPERSNS